MRREEQELELMPASELIEPGQARCPPPPADPDGWPSRLSRMLVDRDLWAIVLALFALATMLVSLLGGLQNR